MEDIISPPRWDFLPRERTVRSGYQVGLYDGAGVHRRSRLGTARDIASSWTQLAVIDEAMTAALVEFRFPDGTRFPCLPVRATNKRGLVYPLEGASWCTGPELVVAHEQGAIINVKDGYRVDWIPGSIRLFEDITRRVGEIRAEAKARNRPTWCSTSWSRKSEIQLYGKLAQAVAGTRIIKDDVEQRQRVQHDVRRDRPDGPERDHQCADGGVLHRTGPGVADWRR